MTSITLQLLDAAREFDNTMSGAVAAELIVTTIDAAGPVIAAEAAALVRQIAGHLNSPSDNTWGAHDGVEADYALDMAMGSVHCGGRTVKPNISITDDRCMTALVDLARERDHAERLELAQLYAGSRDPLGIAFAGVQLVRALAEFTGDAQALLDAVQLALLETARPTQQEES